MSSHKITLTVNGGTSPVSTTHEQAYTYRRGASIQCDVTGTINYTVQWSNNGGTTWVNHATLAAATADASGSFEHPVEKVRVLRNSGTGSVQVDIVGSYN